MAAKAASKERPTWGRVLIAGGTDWEQNGKGGKRNEESDLRTPHVLRSLSHLKISKLLAGCSANYAIAIDVNGVAHMIGKLPAMTNYPKGVVPLLEAVHVSPRAVGLGKGVKWVDGALGRGHFLLLDSNGGVWGAGVNTIGQIGLPVANEVPVLTKVTGPWGRDKIVQVTAGNTFSLFLSDQGKVYAAGSSEHGQLGNGTTGERIVKGNKTAFDYQLPTLVHFDLAGGDKIVQIASGNQHSLALDNDGYVYGWGYDGYCRLGLGDQKDKLTPTLIPQFADSIAIRRAQSVHCGPTSSVVIDRQDLYQIAGKWKLTGDGSSGSPYTSFKHLEEIAGCKVEKVALGGVTHFITTFLDREKTQVQTIGWGQGALHGELGFGDDRGKSSTKPTELIWLRGRNILDIGAGMFFSLFLAVPTNDAEQLERIPREVTSEELCLTCHTDKDDQGVATLECERCDAPYHTDCLDPPLPGIPDVEWFCPKCEEESEQTYDDVVFGDKGSEPAREASAPSSGGAKRRTDSADNNDQKRMRAI